MALSQEIKDALNDEMDFVKCPACGYDDANSSRGVKMHYSYADDDTHPDKLPKYIFRCVQCGEVDEGSNVEQLYCSKDCRILDEVGTLKHKDEEFLQKKIEDEGKRAVQVAEEIGVKSKLVHKWIREYDIGDDYECPSCERSFATSQGVSKHHEEEHGESIRGNTYECEWCGEENWTPRRKDDRLFPKYCNDDCWGESMEGENNPNKDPERRKKISETMKKRHEEGMGYGGGKRDSAWMMENVINKRDDSYLHKEPSEETKQKLSEAQKKLVESGDHHLQDPEMRKQIVKTRDENGTWDWYPNISPQEAQKRAVEARDVFGPKIVEVEETGNTVDSTWEAEVDRLLHSLDLNYYYNDGDKMTKFEMEDGNYVPDFIIPGITKNIVIEVKGWLGYGYNKNKSESYAKQMTQRDDVQYIVYGDVELECDEFVEYGNEEELASLLN